MKVLVDGVVGEITKEEYYKMIWCKIPVIIIEE